MTKPNDILELLNAVTAPDDDLITMLRENVTSRLTKLERLNIRQDKLRREIAQVEARITRLTFPRKSGRPKVHVNAAAKQRAYRQRKRAAE